jgi:hypothetical protein
MAQLRYYVTAPSRTNLLDDSNGGRIAASAPDSES